MQSPEPTDEPHRTEAQPAAHHVADPGKEERAARGLPIVPAMDGFRAFAILGIVLLHLVTFQLRPTSAIGMTVFYGTLPNLVDVLFILSGFVVFLPTVVRAGDFGSVRDYGIRRAARLLPAFWLAIVIVLALLVLWPGSPDPARPGLLSVGVHAIGMHQPAHLIDPGFAVGLGINGPLWTLSLEITFYLLLPLVASQYFKRPLLGLLVTLAITVAWKLGTEHLDAILSAIGADVSPAESRQARVAMTGQFPGWCFQFGLGMTAAWAFVRLRERHSAEWLAKRAGWVQGLSLLGLVPLLYEFGTHAQTGNPLAAAVARGDILLTLAIPTLIATFMLATALSTGRRQAPFAHPRVRALGDISYGTYLIHFPVILFLGALFNSDTLQSFWVLSPIALAISVGYGYLSARLLEQPIRRWARRFGRRGERPAPEAAATAGP